MIVTPGGYKGCGTKGKGGKGGCSGGKDGGKSKTQQMEKMYSELMNMWSATQGDGGWTQGDGGWDGGWDSGWGSDSGWSGGKGGAGKAKGKNGKSTKGSGKSKSKSKSSDEKTSRKRETFGNAGKAPNIPWKSRLSQAYSSVHKMCPVKDVSLCYMTVKEGDGYMASVRSDKFPTEYQAAIVYPTEKLAQESAAMIALEAEFPDIFEAVPEEQKISGASAYETFEDNPANPKRQKQNSDSDEAGRVAGDAKNLLIHGVMILLGRSLKKGDIDFTVHESDGHQVATCTLNCLDGQTFESEVVTGTSKEAKKEAQFSAAQGALAALQPQIDEKLPEHEARKAEKKASQEAKRAEKEALAAP